MRPPDPASHRGQARACGLALLDASRSYERHTLPATAQDDATVLALVGAARGHLRAAYLLADHGHEMEAIVVRRTLVEYALKIGWLLSDKEANCKIWRWDDARTRLRIDRDAEKYPGDLLTDATRMELQMLMADIEADFEPKMPGIPKIECLAAEQMPYAYIAFSIDSQFTHPSGIAAQQLVSQLNNGRFRLHGLPKPGPDGAHVDTYSVCAWMLLRLLTLVDRAISPSLVDSGRLAEIHAGLEGLRPKP